MPTPGASPSAVPGLRRNMVTICAMTATIMQALDTTIANVALPYMQGTLSASQDQINWVLTSYIVAAAIMTAPVGWIANRFGRKNIFIICSRVCAAPHIMEVMVNPTRQAMNRFFRPNRTAIQPTGAVMMAAAIT